MKTIKEVSELIKISKVSIYKALKRPEMQPYISKNKDNVTLVDEIGISLLISLFNREKSETINDIAETVLTSKEVNKLDNDEVNLVLTVLREEIKQKNNEINTLLNIVTNQQKLQATQYIVDNQHEGTSAPIETDKPPKSRFFWKIFGKR